MAYNFVSKQISNVPPSTLTSSRAIIVCCQDWSKSWWPQIR